MASVVYRLSSELQERIAKNVITYGDVKEQIAQDLHLRTDRTRLIIKFEDTEVTPADQEPVTKNRRLIVQRLPILLDGRCTDGVEEVVLDKFRSARTASIKTTGQPTPSLRKDNECLEKYRRMQPFKDLEWREIREYLQGLLRSQRFMVDDSTHLSCKSKRDFTDKLEIRNYLRCIQSKLTRNPFEAFEDYLVFRNVFKGTVYFSRYCGRHNEYFIALERIFYGLFEQDFMST